MLKREEGI